MLILSLAIFLPLTNGTEWLYYKIYGGKNSANEILQNGINSLSEKLILNQKINNWFFIRYDDSNSHIRLRFKLCQTKNLQSVIELTHEYLMPYQKAGVIWKIQTDTYKREIERYGSNSIHLFEELFYYDSSCVINVLNTIEEFKSNHDLLLLVGLFSIVAYLTDFGYSLERKKKFIKSAKDGFDKEFGINKFTSKQLARKYKNFIHLLEKIERNEEYFLNEEWGVLKQIIIKRSNKQREIVKLLIQLEKEGKLEIDIEKGIWSLIHLSINRLVISKARKHELVFYNLLYRYTNRLLAKREASFFNLY